MQIWMMLLYEAAVSLFYLGNRAGALEAKHAVVIDLLSTQESILPTARKFASEWRIAYGQGVAFNPKAWLNCKS